jgi:hypothetical protein
MSVFSGFLILHLTWPYPWWLCPLHHAGMPQQVILLWAAANFRDPPLPRVHSFGFPWGLAARCQSPCFFCSALTNFTVVSFLGTSSCTTTDFFLLDLPPNLWPPSFLDRPTFSLAGNSSWPSSFRDGHLTCAAFLLSGVGFYFFPQVFLVGSYFSQQACHHLFHFHGVVVQRPRSKAVSSPTTSDTSCHVYEWL